jgi:hypothetical protein
VSARQMPISEAARIYEKLKPFLRYIEPWGNYLPARPSIKPVRQATSPDDWPLSFRDYPKPPVPVAWCPKRGRSISFATFLRIYKIEPVIEIEVAA